jgi:uncharacterized small protein (DUF1192 family)
MSHTDDERPLKKISHEIGCDLSMLSADELKARIELMKSEVERLEAEIIQKVSGRAAAENLFRLR